jgi:hypothetical protein
MAPVDAPDIAAAELFLATNARVLDPRRYERLFQGGDGTPVRDAVAAYRNADGGFGNALEPDCRAPGSQQLAVAFALRTLDEAGAWDEQLARGACDWLESVAPPEGGARDMEPSIGDWPHPPWLEPQESTSASPICTGLIAGALHARRVEHPWLARADELMWSLIDGLDGGGAYALRAALAFLQHAPDRGRAEAAFERIGPLVLAVAELDPDAHGEIHGPLDFAPLPDSLARRLFDEDTIALHLDHLAAGQREDGGWTFNWLAWLPLAEVDWRGSLTVDALVVLRANGRL